MQINFHSPDSLFTDALKEYCEEKLTKPVERYKLDGELVRMDVDATLHREATGFRVRFRSPGITILVSTLHPDPYAACDRAVDKLSRKLRKHEERRRDIRRRSESEAGLAPLGGEDSDIFTADEEEVLREMGAWDAVLNA